MDTNLLHSLLKQDPFTAIERTLVSHLRDDWHETDCQVLFAAACCSLQIREGHTFLDLSKKPDAIRHLVSYSWPDLEEWSNLLRSSKLVARNLSDRNLPLIFADHYALYLEKYYSFEQSLAHTIVDRVASNRQTEADNPASQAAAQNFYVITGGPGTGKTTLALKFLDLVFSQADSNKPRIAAVAPTGKAAARLKESISIGLSRLDLPQGRQEQIENVPCLTIHRLLGTLPHRSSFRHHRRNPIPFDVIVIDEASMIDLPLMLRLFDALPSDCQVLMLGDRDQLTSVEVGSVFSDILLASEPEKSPLSHCVHRLTKTYRFSDDSTIFQVCQACRNSDRKSFEKLLATTNEDWKFHNLPTTKKTLPHDILRSGFDFWQTITSCDNVEAALDQLSTQSILTPTKSGPFGSREINRQIAVQIRKFQKLDTLDDRLLHGMPIIVLENNYDLELYNGDLGLVWNDEAYFTSASGQTRKISLASLPAHELAFALTIHKSQGSEFTQVSVLIGPGGHALLSRELLYTAFSRSKEKLVVLAPHDELIVAIDRKVNRATRLAKLLAQIETTF